MDKSDIESQLRLIEDQLAFLREATLTGDTTQLPLALSDLQPMLVDFSHTLRTTPTTQAHSALLRERLKKSLAVVSTLREGVIRQSVVVDRALSAVVPSTQAITYGSSSSVTRHQPYSVPARQSGEFKAFLA
jgi:hypothetical protein